MIEIVSNKAESMMLNKRSNNKIMVFDYDFSVSKFTDSKLKSGDSNNIEKFYLKKSLKRLNNKLKKDNDVRIWVSDFGNKRNMLAIFLINYLKNKNVNIYLCKTEYPLGFQTKSEINDLFKNSELLNKNEIEDYSNEYKKLTKENSDLRVYSDGKFKSYSYDILDEETKKLLYKYRLYQNYEIVGYMLGKRMLNFDTQVPFWESIERVMED